MRWLLAGGQVSVSAFVEDGNSVLAHVHHIGDDQATDPDELPRAERFVVAEVNDGLIVRMSGYATELEARGIKRRYSRGRVGWGRAMTPPTTATIEHPFHERWPRATLQICGLRTQPTESTP